MNPIFFLLPLLTFTNLAEDTRPVCKCCGHRITAPSKFWDSNFVVITEMILVVIVVLFFLMSFLMWTADASYDHTTTYFDTLGHNFNFFWDLLHRIW